MSSASGVDVSLTLAGSSVTLTARPLPLGFHRRLLQRGFVPPAVPREVVRDSRGVALRDERGLAVLREQPQDAAYLVAQARYEERVAAVMIDEAIGDERLRPADAQPASDDDAAAWQTYADALLDAMTAQGLTAGDFARLCRAVGKASGLVEARHEAETDRLFSAAAAAAPKVG